MQCISSDALYITCSETGSGEFHYRKCSDYIVASDSLQCSSDVH